ncbi:MAG: hypothetical protein Q9160_000971, partial [Pyrenula sp. 1 TL-2023]
MVGEPNLQANNQSEWVDLVSKCLSARESLPTILADGFGMGSLQTISESFEDVFLHSTLVDLRCGREAKPKRWFRRSKHKEYDGCVRSGAVLIRLWTTNSEDHFLENVEGKTHLCTFDQQNPHFNKLLMLNDIGYLEQSLLEQETGPTSDFNLANEDSAVVDRNSMRAETVLDTLSSRVGPKKSTISEQGQNSNTDTCTEDVIRHESDSSIDPGLGMEAGKEATIKTPDIEHNRTFATDERRDQLNFQREPKELGNTYCNSKQSNLIGDVSLKERHSPSSKQNHSENVKNNSIDYQPVDELIETLSLDSEPTTNGPNACKRRQVKDSRPKRKLLFTALLPPQCEPFCGRIAILNDMSSSILPKEQSDRADLVQNAGPRIQWITGPPGIGKTAVAIEFAHRHRDKYDFIFWMAANSRASLGRYCHDIAIGLGLVQGRSVQNHEISRKKFLQWLETSGKTFLMIFDDLDLQSDFAMFLPNPGVGSVIVTSRQKPYHSGIVETLALASSLSPKEAIDFLSQATFQGQCRGQENDICLTVRRCDYSPAVLRQLADWSIREKMPMSDINKVLELRDHSPKQFPLGESHPAPVSADPLERLPLLYEDLTLDHASLFRTLCVFGRDSVDERLLRGAQRSTKFTLEGFPRTNEGLSRSLHQLWKRALINRDAQRGRVWLSHYGRDAARASMESATWSVHLGAAAALIQEQWPSKRKFRNVLKGYWPEFEDLHSHAIALSDSCTVGRYLVQDAANRLKQLYNAARGNYVEDRGLLHRAYGLCSTDRTLSSHQLPRRCLSVGEASELRLLDTDGLTGSYLALSHVFGMANASIKLTSNTVQSFKRGIEISTLSIAIRDAIKVTRMLGIRYLWIDTLCIIQDSLNDMTEEISHLADYFTNATAIIADKRPDPMTPLLAWQGDLCYDLNPYSLYGDLPSLEITSKPPSIPYAECSIITNSGLPHRCRLLRSCSLIDDADEWLLELLTVESDLALMTELKKQFDTGSRRLETGSTIEAIASLTLLRDRLSPVQGRHPDQIHIFNLATALLGTAFHLLATDEIALEILRTAYASFSQSALGEWKTDYGVGRLMLSMSACLFGLGRVHECEEKLISARNHFTENAQQPNECKHLQSALDYFQDNEIMARKKQQGHIARILHRHRLLYQAQGNRPMQSAFAAAARDAFEQYETISEGDISSKAIQESLSQQHFDALVEPWHR